MNSTGRNRRQLLKGGAALAGMALAGVRPARAAEPEAEAAVGNIPNPGFYDPDFTEKFWGQKSAHPEGRRTPIVEQLGIITPNQKAFTTNHRNPTPNINAREHRLLVHGMVDRPLIFTMEDLRRLPAVSRVHYVACAGNSYLGVGSRRDAKTVNETHGGSFCAEWTGVLLSTVLKDGRRAKGGELAGCGISGCEKAFDDQSAGKGPGTTLYWPTAKMASPCVPSRVTH